MFFCWCRVAVLWTWAPGLLLIDHGQLDLFLVWIHVARFVMNRYAKSMRSVSKCVVILLFFHLFSYGCYIWIIGCTKPALPALGEASSDSPPEPAECIRMSRSMYWINKYSACSGGNIVDDNQELIPLATNLKACRVNRISWGEMFEIWRMCGN